MRVSASILIALALLLPCLTLTIFRPPVHPDDPPAVKFGYGDHLVRLPLKPIAPDLFVYPSGRWTRSEAMMFGIIAPGLLVALAGAVWSWPTRGSTAHQEQDGASSPGLAQD